MPVETANYISDLNPSNPAHSDGLNQADAHMRLTKAVLQATLAHTGQLSNSDNQLIPVDGSATKPAYSFASEPTLGLYRSAAGVVSVAGGVLKGGIPVGAVFMFANEPASLGKTSTDTGKDWLELNGNTYNTADYPKLAAVFNASGATFAVPRMNDTGRFPRSRTDSLSTGAAQSNQNKSHTHVVAGNTGTESVSHSHAFAGTTGVDYPDHTHAYTVAVVSAGETGGGGFSAPASLGGASTGGASTRHQHDYSGNTGTESAHHTHSINFTSSTGSADGSEARPESLVFVFCIKT